jgi:hypothetical protein
MADGVRRWLLAAAYLTACLLVPVYAAEAVTVADLELPDKAAVGERELVLNGAGLRTKLGFKVYAGALYLPKRATTPESVIGMAGPKRMHLHFIYRKVARKKLVRGWRDGFFKNLADKEHDELHSRIDRFCALFDDTLRGETYTFDYIPGQGTQIFHNGKLRTTIEGEDFMKGLMLIWLGDRPAHKGLKRSLLGGE